MLSAVEEQYRKALKRVAPFQTEAINLSASIAIRDGDQEPLKLGGWFDRITREYVAPANDEAVAWEVGKGQLPPLMFSEERSANRFVCIGAMGAGKTEILVRAALKTALEFRNADIGVIAPTAKRLRIIWSKLKRLLHPAWVAEERYNDGVIALVNGVRFEFVAAKAYSAQLGSPIQGQSWVAAFIDEEQDLTDDAIADVMMRGREAPDGYYPVLSTCTLKDTPEWRERLTKYRSQANTEVYRMEATANPFVAPEYWESLKQTLSPRVYRLRVLALDAQPERAVYPDFSRERHVKPIPWMLAEDVTREVTKGYDYLIGHDPGTLWDVSLILKAFRMPGDVAPRWWVIGEVSTRQTSTEQHLIELTAALRERHALPRACIVRADPYGNTSASGSKPDKSVYTLFRKAGFKTKPAAYSKANPTKPGSVPVDAAIEAVNMLWLNTANETRLYIASDEHGNPVARKLVAALETQERDLAGKAEQEKKDIHDTSHWSASLRYALWPYERVRIHDPNWKIANGEFARNLQYN